MKSKNTLKKVFFNGLVKKDENRSLDKSFFQGLSLITEKLSLNNLFAYYKIIFFITILSFSTNIYSQVILPDANSCTSKDLELVGASLPAPNNDPCACGGTRTLMLTINNKTGSIRTSFALWGTLKIYNSDGSQKSSENIFACAGPIPASSLITMESSKTISFECGESLEIVDLFLAWTSANKKETCDVLEANPSVIAPKCGTLPKIQVVAGVDANFNKTDATCLTGGSVVVSPFGGVGPYMAAVDTGTYQSVVGSSITFSNLSAGPHTFKIKDSRNCETTKSRTIISPSSVTANAGDDFTKTCMTNTSGGTIGEGAVTGFSYLWTSVPAGFTSTDANPSVNPSVTTTYTVVKTNNSTGCYDDDSVTVTVNNASVTANAGDDFTKTCTAYTSGGTIGEVAVTGFSYSWTSVPSGFTSSEANPSVNPSVTTTYTVVKTNNSSGCYDDDSVTVTVNNASVTANAGDDFTKTCAAYTSGGTIGEGPVTGFSYSWTSVPSGFTSSEANPSVNPTVTTTYTVVKTNNSSGCYDDDSVTVTVNNASVTANAGDDFTKTCTAYTSGGTIGEGAVTGFSYSWTSVPAGFTSSEANPSVNPSVTTTYTVVKTNNSSGCYDDDSVTVTVNDTMPDTPSVCIVQPSLCGPAKGSITINSPLGAEYEYSIDNGSTWQSETLFDNLAAGSVTGIIVRNKTTGCTSSAADCSVSNCTATVAKIQDEEEFIELEKVVKQETTVKAFPNPFRNTISFVVDVPESGEGSLELMNMQGEKVKTVFTGKFNDGRNTYEVNLPSHQPSTLIYILRVGNERVTGKLIQM